MIEKQTETKCTCADADPMYTVFPEMQLISRKVFGHAVDCAKSPDFPWPGILAHIEKLEAEIAAWKGKP